MRSYKKTMAILAAVMVMAMLLSPVPAAGSETPVKSGDGGDNLLQFTSAGHVLGFSEDSVIIASASHMLKTEFVNANAVAPEAGDVTVVYEASEGTIVKSTYYLNATKEGVPVDNIRLGYNRPVSIDENGNLVIAYETGTITEAAPVAWQEIEGERQPVTVGYALYGEQEAGFSLGDYVHGIPVVIDPETTWNTFLGGSGSDEGRGSQWTAVATFMLPDTAVPPGALRCGSMQEKVMSLPPSWIAAAAYQLQPLRWTCRGTVLLLPMGTLYHLRTTIPISALPMWHRVRWCGHSPSRTPARPSLPFPAPR